MLCPACRSEFLRIIREMQRRTGQPIVNMALDVAPELSGVRTASTFDRQLAEVKRSPSGVLPSVDSVADTDPSELKPQ